MLPEITKKLTIPKAVMVIETLSEYQALSVPTKYGEISITYSHSLKDKRPIEVVN
jgi:hypothetical protein